MAKAKKKGPGDCGTCGAKCCRYVVVELERPTDRIDREEIRWLLAHENVLVYIDGDDGTWNVQFNTPCTHLDADHRCTIYDRRFDICRDHDAETCESSDGEQTDVIFRTTEDFDRWRRAKKARKRRRKERKRREKDRAKEKKRKGKGQAEGRRGRSRKRSKAKA
jgi:Fe-S-cluster containining protein